MAVAGFRFLLGPLTGFIFCSQGRNSDRSENCFSLVLIYGEKVDDKAQFAGIALNLDIGLIMLPRNLPLYVYFCTVCVCVCLCVSVCVCVIVCVCVCVPRMDPGLSEKINKIQLKNTCCNQFSDTSI